MGTENAFVKIFAGKERFQQIHDFTLQLFKKNLGASCLIIEIKYKNKIKLLLYFT
jgi:hypothetical protein